MAGVASLEARFLYRFPTVKTRRLFRAPGRVNLIGEHTDYNQGLVLPIAIQLACFAVAGGTDDGRLRVFSENQEDGREWTIQELTQARPSHHWTDYIVGVAQQLIAAGYSIRPGSILLHSTVPLGGGLSSSAAVEVAVALAMLDDQQIDRLDLVRLCQRAENQFVGLPSGIMDQYVSVFGEVQHALKLDCRSLTHQLVQLPDELVMVAVNSMVKHSLGQTAYRERVAECRQAAEILGVSSLRDVTPANVDAAKSKLPENVYRRARHVTSENNRVEQFAAASSAGDRETMGSLLLASHESLRRDYEVSCEELDYLVETAMGIDGVYGARMIGGGFGGCTLNILKPETLDYFERTMAERYQEKFGLRPELYPCTPASGAGSLDEASVEVA